MIRIHKPKTPPKKLATDGKEKQKELCDLYSQNPSLYETGTKRTKAEKKTIQKFNFASSIYGDTTVKQELSKAQYQKCCFCDVLWSYTITFSIFLIVFDLFLLPWFIWVRNGSR